MKFTIIIFLAIVVLLFLRFGIAKKLVAMSGMSGSASTSSSSTIKKGLTAFFNFLTWKKLLIFLVILFIADILFMGRSVTHFVGGKFFPDEFVVLEKIYTPNGEEVELGSIEPGKYRVEFVGSYQKKWDSGKLSPINGSTGINHPTVDKNILPVPTRPYGSIFAKVGGNCLFQGESFRNKEKKKIFVDANIPKMDTNGNYENEGSVVVKIIKEE